VSASCGAAAAAAAPAAPWRLDNASRSRNSAPRPSRVTSNGAELNEVRAWLPEDAALHSQVVQKDVLARLDMAHPAIFTRVPRGEKAGGCPPLAGTHSRARLHSSTRSTATGTCGDRLAGPLPTWPHGRALESSGYGNPHDRHREQQSGRLVCVLLRGHMPTDPLPLTGRETGLEVGLNVVLLTAGGWRRG